MNFYKNLEKIQRPIAEVLAQEKNFVNLPSDWHVVVADINDSSGAVANGRHPDINLIAAGCIIVALNISKKHNVDIPYFFGGDGGVVLVPDEILSNIMAGLEAHKINSRVNFSLELRTGSVRMSTVLEAGHQIRIAKVEESAGFRKALLLGTGLKYAEDIIKAAAKIGQPSSDPSIEVDTSDLDLEGMECKWDKIKPPLNREEIVCFLIEARNHERQPTVYSETLRKLEEIYGSSEKRHPISISMLRLKSSVSKIRREMIARYSKWNPFSVIKNWLRAIAGRLYFKYNFKVDDVRGKDYLLQLIAFSEILTIDGRINTIVTGNSQQRKKFVDWLQAQERLGSLVFGHYVSSASVMTCYVQDMHNEHIHFVDGADGGYTEAARELKPKLRKAL